MCIRDSSRFRGRAGSATGPGRDKPGRRDPQPARRALPCGAASRAIRRVTVESGYALSKPACNVVFCSLVGWIRKDLLGLVELDHFTEQEESGELCDARSLLHIVSDDHNGVLLFELEDKLFNFSG